MNPSCVSDGNPGGDFPMFTVVALIGIGMLVALVGLVLLFIKRRTVGKFPLSVKRSRWRGTCSVVSLYRMSSC